MVAESFDQWLGRIRELLLDSLASQTAVELQKAHTRKRYGGGCKGRRVVELSLQNMHRSHSERSVNSKAPPASGRYSISVSSVDETREDYSMLSDDDEEMSAGASAHPSILKSFLRYASNLTHLRRNQKMDHTK